MPSGPFLSVAYLATFFITPLNSFAIIDRAAWPGIIMASGTRCLSVMNRARRVIGSACCLGASAIFLFGEGSATIPPAIFLLVLGIILVATARKR